jgi:hypothetical protein
MLDNISNFLKGGVSALALLLFFMVKVQASSGFFILKNEAIINPKSVQKINEIGSELKSKTAVNLFLVAKDSINNQTIVAFEKEVASTLVKPFILLAYAKEEKKVDIITSSKELDEIVDKDDILDDYIIPILVSYDKNSEVSKSSAGLLNGYMEIADRVAGSKGIELESSFGSSNKVFNDVKRYIFYPIIIIGLLVYLYSVYWRRE